MSHLRALDADVEAALEPINVPAYVIDKHGIIRWINPAARRVVGDVRGRQYTSVCAPEETRRAREIFAQKVVGGAKVTDVEGVLIDALDALGVAAGRRAGLRGVWVGERKIASIGIALRRWVAWHGFALNVAHDVSGFAPITPCGITGIEMTSVAREGGPSEMAAVLPVVLDRFVAAFGYAGWRPLEAYALGGETRP